ncbi:hypothetical protein [Kineococcus sp. R86509]|uniref:hypothetical protein n=1 Tax=Kineococcus sp. R86509 TaxID=3093851 RepID=UPI0036D2E588
MSVGRVVVDEVGLDAVGVAVDGLVDELVDRLVVVELTPVDPEAAPVVPDPPLDALPDPALLVTVGVTLAWAKTSRSVTVNAVPAEVEVCGAEEVMTAPGTAAEAVSAPGVLLTQRNPRAPPPRTATPAAPASRERRPRPLRTPAEFWSK